MKVYLINPPVKEEGAIIREGRCMQRKGIWTTLWPPITMATIAAILEKDGLEVRFADCSTESISSEQLRDLLREYNPDLVVINTATPSIVGDLSIATLAKEVRPSIKTVAIGNHVSALPKESLEMESNLDYVVLGEPEYSVRDIALCLQQGRSMTGVNGIAYKDNGSVILTNRRPSIKDLDELPFPNWHHINLNLYHLPFTERPFLMVSAGRGCPYNCTFCVAPTYYGSKLRIRSARRIVDEIEWNKNEFAVSDFLFWTESFTINDKHARAICDEIIRRRLDVKWVCTTRVDNVNPELLSKLKLAGCWMIGFGIESGNQGILNGIRKGITLEQIEAAVRVSKIAGLEVTGHCILGLPGETRETAMETVEMAKRLELDFVQFYCAVPFPGSDLYSLAVKNAWINTKDWSRFEQNFSVLDMPQLKAEEIMELRSLAYRKFYLRPATIKKTLRRIRSFGDLKRFLYMLRDFLDWI